MQKSNYFKFALASAMAMCVSLNGYGQECDNYINKQTNKVNSAGIMLKSIGKVAAKVVDGVFRTDFSALIKPTGEKMQMLDVLQYNTCQQLQTVKNEFNRENLEEKARNTVNEMAKLLAQSGSLPPEVSKLLVENGNIESSQVGSQPQAATSSQPVAQPKSANEVNVPDSPLPAKPGGEWVTVTFPCQTYTKSGSGTIRAMGMETSTDPQIAKSIASLIALEELASKIEITVNSVTEYYIRSVSGDREELIKDFKRITKTTVNQTVRGYKTVCEEFRQNATTQKYQCFIAYEINEETVVKPVYEELKQNAELKSNLPDYSKFKQTFDKVMSFYENAGF